MKRAVVDMVSVLALIVFGQRPPIAPYFGAGRLDPAPEFAVRLVREQFADVLGCSLKTA